jgi:hypothetical protein
MTKKDEFSINDSSNSRAALLKMMEETEGSNRGFETLCAQIFQSLVNDTGFPFQ